MKKTALLGALALAAFSVAVAGALTTAPASGDTCTASGSGTAYTLHISLPPGAQQFGFAFGARGASVTNAVIPGTNGNFTTQGAAANTSGAWLSDAPLPTASTVTLTTSGAASSLTVVPASDTTPTYLGPITCRFTDQTATRTVSFTVGTHALYSGSAGAWRVVVTIPAAGLVSAKQLEPTVGSGGAAPVTATPLVQTHRVALKSGGQVTLVLRPTAKGTAALKAGALHVKLQVTFDAADGRSGTRLLSLTLHR